MLRPLVDRFVAGTDLDGALPGSPGWRPTGSSPSTTSARTPRTGPAPRPRSPPTGPCCCGWPPRGSRSRVEVSVKLSALGQGLPDGDACALAGAQEICAAAAEAGTTVTVDMEDHTTTDATLTTVGALRADFPWVGAVLQSQLRRTEGDCRELAGPGSRVRLCKGAYDEPESVAFTGRRGRRPLVRPLPEDPLRWGRDPLVATHDPRLVAIAQHQPRPRPRLRAADALRRAPRRAGRAGRGR